MIKLSCRFGFSILTTTKNMQYIVMELWPDGKDNLQRNCKLHVVHVVYVIRPNKQHYKLDLYILKLTFTDTRTNRLKMH